MCIFLSCGFTNKLCKLSLSSFHLLQDKINDYQINSKMSNHIFEQYFLTYYCSKSQKSKTNKISFRYNIYLALHVKLITNYIC